MKIRKKTVFIEVRQLTIENTAEIMKWCGSTKLWIRYPMRAIIGIIIPTLEGDHEASFGDFIIQGIKGEFYPCKPDIFKLTIDKALEVYQGK